MTGLAGAGYAWPQVFRFEACEPAEVRRNNIAFAGSSIFVSLSGRLDNKVGEVPVQDGIKGIDVIPKGANARYRFSGCRQNA